MATKKKSQKKDKMTPKKVIYIILTMVLGGIMGCLIFGLLSLKFYLSPCLYDYFVLIGIILGVPLGFYWWKVVYIEHRHWRSMKKSLLIIFSLLLLTTVTGCAIKETKPPIIGGDKDAHGCLIAAGYSWCDAKQKCLRTWEEACETPAPVIPNKEVGPITLDTPQPETNISSPLTILGKARGTWFFEASFPVILTNWDGLIIAEGTAQAQGDWMTEDFVPFEATLNFEKPDTGVSNRGALILKKDNPSGLPENDDALEITVFFE